MQTNNFPVAVIGAGPIGLAAAAHLLRKGEMPLIFEAGRSAGAAVLQWGMCACSPPGASCSTVKPPRS
jgi:NADPH-dependent glutamate synthase beta subunit-like oxidoreductase